MCNFKVILKSKTIKRRSRLILVKHVKDITEAIQSLVYNPEYYFIKSIRRQS